MNFLRRMFYPDLVLITLAGATSVLALDNEASRLETAGSPGIFKFVWLGQEGRSYFIQNSPDLINWITLPALEVGAGQLIEYGYTTDASRFFFRLRYSDLPAAKVRAADFDHDGLSNWTEVQASLDAFATDTDRDGLEDHAEYLLGIGSLRSTDSDGDGVDDDLDAYPADATRSVYVGNFTIQVAAPLPAVFLP